MLITQLLNKIATAVNTNQSSIIVNCTIYYYPLFKLLQKIKVIDYYIKDYEEESYTLYLHKEYTFTLLIISPLSKFIDNTRTIMNNTSCNSHIEIKFITEQFKLKRGKLNNKFGADKKAISQLTTSSTIFPSNWENDIRPSTIKKIYLISSDTNPICKLYLITKFNTQAIDV